MASLSSAAFTRGVALSRGALTSKTPSYRCRAVSLVVRAEDKMARNSIDLSKRKLEKGTGEPVNVTFLGAGGQEVVVQCPEDQYILDAAIDAGLELPYTCRGGICGACVARCTQGPAGIDHRDITDLEFTLDEDEQADGLALLCMCYPVGDITLETQSDWGMRVGEWKGAKGEISGREPTKLMTGELKGL
jgi:2Fe-2S type ferredoxin